MVKILASQVDTYLKIDNKKVVKEISDKNKLITNIKKYLKQNNAILFIASNKNDFEKIDIYSNLLFESLKLSGIIFKEYNVLDNRTINDAQELVEKSDLIFLSGGDTYIQNEFFKEIKLKELLENYNGIIIGQSAGSINMATDVFNSPEQSENSEPIYFDCLGLTEINIEPHWKNNTLLFNKDEQYQRKYIIEESKRRDIYAICDGGYILINEDKNEIYGEVYIVRNGELNILH